jgi:CTP synthase
VGKYTKLKDSYLSIVEALRHAGVTVGVKPNLVWVEATDVEEGKIKVEDVLSTVDGAVILPGFGKRGAEGKVKAIRYLRESNIPTLGICFGLQLSVVEFARDVIGLENANSTEIDPSTPHPVVDLLPWERDVNEMGGTLRLGASEIRLVKGTQLYDLYGRDVIYERHRHRYEVNPKYVDRLVEAGLIISAWNPQGLVEGAELPHKEHRFFLGTQAHPEFKSRPLAPSPPYVGLLRASTSR